MPRARGSLTLGVSLFLASCGTAPSSAPGEGTTASGASGAAVVASAVASVDAGCSQRVARLMKEPALPGAPAFEASRIELVARPRGTPLLWMRAPAIDASASPAAASAITKLSRTDRPLAMVKGLVRRYGKSPETLRSIFLREGYVYAEEPGLALAMVETLRLTHLFREPVVHLLRGRATHTLSRAERTRYLPERYVHADGPLKGAVAELLLGDRVAVEARDLSRDPAALDLAAAAAEEGFDRLRVKHLAAGGLVAEVRYVRGPWVTAVLELDGPALRLGCADGAAEAMAARAKAIEASTGMRAALAKLRETVRAQVQEEPPFDEPKDEPDGEQQDGALRREWRRAYGQGLRRFTVGDVTYDVYDDEGRPVPPQVCVDFITDTWERASGTWYRPLPEAAGDERPRPAPERVVGGIDFDLLDLQNRRSVAELVAFARRHPEKLEVLDVPQEERVPFTRRTEMFAWLAARSDDFAPGDVLVIHGMKSDGKPHYHSVMIVEHDPITGVPTLVAGNAGRPREQTLEGVMARSPKRSIKHRLRPKTEWLVPAIVTRGGAHAASAK